MSRFPLLAALVCAACTSAATFDSGRSSPNTGMIDFADAAGGRDLHTLVFGNPFPVPDTVFVDDVVTTLNARNSRTPGNFTTTPGPTARAEFQLVLLFNPAKRGLPSRLCRSPDTVPLAPGSDRPIRLQIAFCQGSREISARRGSLPAATGPTDPVFENFLAQALQLAQPTRKLRRPLE